MKNMIYLLFALLSFKSFAQTKESTHLKNIQQLTHGGDNAEAYFSFDSKWLSCQVTNPKWALSCDQIFDFNIAQAASDSTYRPKMVSTGKGRTTCSYYLPGDSQILYASTHLGGDACPPAPAPRKDRKYLWAIYSEFDIFVANKQGEIVKQLTDAPGYDAEATVSPDGKKIVFTSTRNGDLDLYVMDIDGKNIKQITFGLGYDGGAFFSPNSKQLVFRSSRPKTEEEIKEYKDLLAENLVAPTNMEIYTCNVDGSSLKQVTKLGKANWAPFFHPNGKRIIFSSNHASLKGYDFQLYSIKTNGKDLQQITTESQFNAFPMFSPDGKKIVWSSNRNNGGTRDTNLFIADWEE